MSAVALLLTASITNRLRTAVNGKVMLFMMMMIIMKLTFSGTFSRGGFNKNTRLFLCSNTIPFSRYSIVTTAETLLQDFLFVLFPICNSYVTESLRFKWTRMSYRSLIISSASLDHQSLFKGLIMLVKPLNVQMFLLMLLKRLANSSR